ELQKLMDQKIIKDYSFDSQKNRFILAYTREYEVIAPNLFQLFERNQLYPRSIKKIDPSLESIFLEVIQ
ncbi:MAG: ABC transporter ATP-binding protein, partial [Enterococcus hulanensis]